MEATQPQPTLAPCPHCGTLNPETSRFCKACGASLVAPPDCPACGAPTAIGSKFCGHCGEKLVGERPPPKVTPPVAPIPIPSRSANGSEADAEATASARERLRAEAASLPPPKPPSSNILSNVLLFVALLLATVVIIYVMNKDAPKVVSPFEGGPAPGAAARPASGEPIGSAPSGSEPSGGGEAAAAGAAIEGRVVLGEGQKRGQGTLFVIVRQLGVTRGPPVAVRKIESPTFPQEFSVTAANTMFQGMPFEGPFDIHARLDQDGNAMTKSAGDLVASTPASGIKPGAEPVTVTLDKRL